MVTYIDIITAKDKHIKAILISQKGKGNMTKLLKGNSE